MLRVALLGTQQAPDALPALELGDIPASATRAQQLLRQAGTLALMQKAGFQLLASALPPSAAPETQQLLGPTGRRLLRLLLSRPHYHSLLSQYLSQMAQHRRVVPPGQLADVLHWLQDQPRAAPFVVEALGERGRWLAAQNPDWHFVEEVAARHAPTEADWHTGPTPSRRRYLETLLRTDPTRAAQLLAEALPQENTATQVALLSTLDALPLTELLPADLAAGLAPLLASRAKEVRQTAARGLVRVADSPLLPRLWAHAEPLLQVKRKSVGKVKLTIALPTGWSAEWQRDGIEQKTTDYPGGEKAGQLGQLLALLPPSRWANAWNVSATEAVALAAASDWAAVLLPAWLRAARLHHEADFALALLLHEAGAPSLPPKSQLISEASRVLSPTQQLTWLLAALPPSASTLPANSAWAHWLALAEHPWQPALRQRALPLLRAALRQPPSWAPEQQERDQAVRSLLQSLGSSTDPDLLPLLTAELGDPSELPPRFAEEVAQVLELLALRPQLAASLLESA